MTATEMMTECPTPEDLAAFVDERLDEGARRQVIEHMADCADCRDIVREATLLQTAEDETKVVPFRSRGKVAAAALAAAASVAVIAGFPMASRWIAFQRTDGMSRIVEAQSEMKQRNVAARLSGGFAHRELKKVMRSAGKESSIDVEQLQLLKAVEDLDEKKHPRALAAGLLLIGRPEDRDEALRLMEEAVRRTPDPDPMLLNDLAAVYLETGAYELALTTVERAWAMSKTPEIAWNRALAYQNSGRDADAIRAWEDYLKLDPSSPWADEAREKLDLLRSPL